MLNLKISNWCATVACLACCMQCLGCTAPPKTVAEATTRLTESFSGSIRAVEEGVVAYDERFGRVEASDSDSAAQFRIGSVTKTFTAAAIALLVDDQELQLETTLQEFFPAVPNAKEITIRHLLEHRSGMRDFSQRDYEQYVSHPTAPSREVILDLVASKRSRFRPDSRFEYCNAGYVLLGFVIEEVSGRSYEDFVKSRLFEPLGLSDTVCATLDRDVPNLVQGFGSGMSEDATEYDFTMIMAAGGIVSTADDLVKWCEAFDAGHAGPIPDWYRTDPLGWKRDERFGRPVMFHLGNTNTFSTLVLRFRDAPGSSYIVLSNEGGTSMHSAIKPLAALLFSRPE